MEKQLTYSDVVNYDLMDPFKIACQKAALTTASNIERFTDHGLKVKEIAQSRGESAYEVEVETVRPMRFRIAQVEEGLGTKNVIAHQYIRELGKKLQIAVDLKEVFGKSFYRSIAIDNAAMILNDLATRGATPISFMLHVAASESGWFTDEERNNDLIEGTVEACDKTRCSWGGGESPALRNVIMPDQAVLSGSAVGFEFPFQSDGKIISEDNLEEGLRIILLNSSGPHANGISLLRIGLLEMLCYEMNLDFQKPKQRLDAYTYALRDGQTYGEAIMTPTKLYSRVMDSLVSDRYFDWDDKGVHQPLVEYAIHISGHGWRKLMRAKSDFTYVIDKIPEPQPIFQTIQKLSGMDNGKIYEDYNMGAGFALFVKPQFVDIVKDKAEYHGLRPLDAGYVEKGPKRVVINPIGVEFKGESLQIR